MVLREQKQQAKFSTPVEKPVVRKADLQMEQIDITRLKTSKRELRKHTPRKISQLMAQITQFGQIVPLIISNDNEVLAGVARLQALTQLGVTTVTVVRACHLNSDAELEAFRIADNKLAQGSKWNDKALSEALQELISLNFDIEALGFSTGEVDVLLASLLGGEPPEAGPGNGKPFVREGDVFAFGAHRLMCGNALNLEHCQRLMAGELADMAFTDPPYNCRVQGHVSGRGVHDEFVMASGEMADDEFRVFLSSGTENLKAITRPGALSYVAMDAQGIEQLIAAGKSVGLDYIHLIVWDKMSAGMGSFYRRQHELFALFRTPGAGHRNNVELGRNGRHRTDVWAYLGASSFSRSRQQDLDDHPTVKPWELIADAIKDCTKRGEVVVDLFAGSGSTAVAAEKTGRVARLMELDPRHAETALRKYQRTFGVEAVHEESGLPLSDLLAQRAEAPAVAAPPRRRVRQPV